jgi:hypothetical protein
VGGAGLAGSEGYNSFVSIAYPVWPIALSMDGINIVIGTFYLLFLNCVVFLVFCISNRILSKATGSVFFSTIVLLFTLILSIYCYLGLEFSIFSGFIGILIASFFYITASFLSMSEQKER